VPCPARTLVPEVRRRFPSRIIVSLYFHSPPRAFVPLRYLFRREASVFRIRGYSIRNLHARRSSRANRSHRIPRRARPGSLHPPRFNFLFTRDAHTANTRGPPARAYLFSLLTPLPIYPPTIALLSFILFIFHLRSFLLRFSFFLRPAPRSSTIARGKSRLDPPRETLAMPVAIS